MSAQYFNLSELATAASAQDCSVHMHIGDNGKPVFSVGNSNTGAREFSDYFDALEYISDPTTYTAGDCAEQAGNLIATNCLNDILNAPSQAVRGAALHTALLDLQRLPHGKRAAAGFAVALVNPIEIGLQHLPKVSE
jgi:hypothetical protein